MVFYRNLVFNLNMTLLLYHYTSQSVVIRVSCRTAFLNLKYLGNEYGMSISFIFLAFSVSQF